MRSTLSALLGLLALSACANTTGVAAGGECFLATDCAQGLVCIPKTATSQTRICVNASQLTSVETILDAGADAASGDAGALPNYDAEMLYDTGTQAVDVGTPTKKDAGESKDSGSG